VLLGSNCDAAHAEQMYRTNPRLFSEFFIPLAAHDVTTTSTMTSAKLNDMWGILARICFKRELRFSGCNRITLISRAHLRIRNKFQKSVSIFYLSGLLPCFSFSNHRNGSPSGGPGSPELPSCDDCVYRIGVC
jgi:hypothetical protein